jgi:MFS family permease
MKQKLKILNILHVLNDGYSATIVLLLPLIVEEYGYSLTQIGGISSMIYLIPILVALPVASFSNKLGGFRLLIFGLLIYSLAFLALSFSGDLINLYLVFSLSAVGFGIFHPIAFALIAKWADKVKRGKYLGDFTAIGEIGKVGIFASVIYFSTKIGWQQGALILGSTGIIVFIYFLFKILKKSKVKLNKRSNYPNQTSYLTILRQPKFISALIVTFIDEFASNTFYIYLPFLIIFKDFNLSNIAYFTAAYFIGGILGKSFLGRLTDKFGNNLIFILSEILMGSFILILILSNNFILIMLVLVIVGAAVKGTIPLTINLAQEAVDHLKSYDKAMGIRIFLVQINAALAALFYGYISESFNIEVAFYIMAILSFVAIIPIGVYKLFFKSKIL